MKLHWFPRSSIVRKVMITIHECNLISSVDLVRSVAILSASPRPEVFKNNPLGKIPVLIRNQEEPLFDSSGICEYLDMKSEGA